MIERDRDYFLSPGLPPHGLPGHGPPERCFDDVVDFLPAYEVSEDYIEIQDPVWGVCRIGDQPGDQVFLDLVDNPLVRRMMAIEQLTLDAQLTTIPNTSFFSRWEHIWGSVVFVRKMIEQNDLPYSDREKLVLQLRTFVSDLGHTAFSHLGDWMFQGPGGTEDQHDQELLQILEYTGVESILRRHGLAPEEVVFPDGEDWIEAPSPDLCVDRVDYGVREINRWQSRSIETYLLRSPSAFKVIGGKLVMASAELADMFYRGFSVLPTEHWGEPVHRLQLRLLEEMVKRGLTGHHNLHVNWLDGPEQCHPRDAMYSIDRDFMGTMVTSDPFMWSVLPIAREIGQQQRNIFVQQRREQISRYLRGYEGDEGFPMPGEAKGWHSHMPLHASRVEIIPVEDQSEVTDFGSNCHTVDFYLPPLKSRRIDPPFLNERGEVTRLSDYNPRIAEYDAAQAKVMKQAYVARLLVAEAYKQHIEEGLADNARHWPEVLARPRMEASRFSELIRDAAGFAINGFVYFHWNR